MLQSGVLVSCFLSTVPRLWSRCWMSDGERKSTAWRGVAQSLLLTFQSLAIALRTTRFNNQKFYTVLTLRWLLCTDLRTATFALRNISRVVLYNRGGECLLRGTDWVLKLSEETNKSNTENCGTVWNKLNTFNYVKCNKLNWKTKNSSWKSAQERWEACLAPILLYDVAVFTGRRQTTQYS
jgi:hypothetical protein